MSTLSSLLLAITIVASFLGFFVLSGPATVIPKSIGIGSAACTVASIIAVKLGLIE